MNQTQFNFKDFGKRFSAWKLFHRENPVVFSLFAQFAEQALRAGRERFSAHAIGERIRWYTAIETTDMDYKINDHHWPYYARLLMEIDSRFEGFFEVRDSRFDSTAEEIARFHGRITGDGK